MSCPSKVGWASPYGYAGFNSVLGRTQLYSHSVPLRKSCLRRTCQSFHIWLNFSAFYFKFCYCDHKCIYSGFYCTFVKCTQKHAVHECTHKQLVIWSTLNIHEEAMYEHIHSPLNDWSQLLLWRLCASCLCHYEYSVMSMECYGAFVDLISIMILVLCEYSKFRIESNSYFSILFETSTIIWILTVTDFLLI